MPEFKHKSLSGSKYADSVVELDARIGKIMDKLCSHDGQATGVLQ
jgi:arylsulfatase